MARKKKKKTRKFILIDNRAYYSAQEASETLGIHIDCLKYRIKSDLYPNYTIEEEEC